MNATALRAMLVAKLQQAGAQEPEDGAHDIIVRLLARGALEIDQSPAYWWVAAKNMTRRRRSEARRLIPWGEGIDVTDVTEPDEVEPDVSGLNLAAEELAWLLAYHAAPAGTTRSSRNGGSSSSVKACRLRKKARAA